MSCATITREDRDSGLRRIPQTTGREILSAPLPDVSIDPSSAVRSVFVDIENSQTAWYRLKETLGLHIDWKNQP